MAMKRLTILVDDVEIAASADQNLLAACLSAKLDVPYFCWHPALGSVGSCRQCAVKLFRGPMDTAGQIVMACMTPVTEGMRVSLSDDEAQVFHEAAIELVLTNHPHDCPVCEVGGECHLQDMTVLTGHSSRRHRFAKRTHLNQDLGPFIRHEMNRCIGCYRCVRFYRDHAGGRDFGVFGANKNIYFGRQEPGALESEFAGNLAEVCPTGVFVDKPFSARFRRRWDMRATPTVCPHCAVGCNITLQEREGEFHRVTNRYNATLNGYFLCDRGRFGAGFIAGSHRLRQSRRINRDGAVETLSSAEARDALAAILRRDDVIGIGSPRASIESNFALRSLVGAENFYSGLADRDAEILAGVIEILRDRRVPLAVLADTAAADAILILGDDPSDIAPILALALRQAAQRTPAEMLAERGVPSWHDSAARTIDAGDAIFLVATPAPTRLDDLASLCHRDRPNRLVELGFRTAHRIDPAAPAPDRGEAEIDARADQFASALSAARHPLIVVGGTAGGIALLRAAANIAIALHRTGRSARLCMLVPEADSIGLGLIDSRPLSMALARLKDSAAPAIILENDLHRRGAIADIDAALGAASSVCVLDHLDTTTARRANIAVAVGCFADGDGTLVNFEGRAQRLLKAILGSEDPPQSWQALREAGVAAGRLDMTEWTSHAAVLDALGAAIPDLAPSRSLWPARSADRPKAASQPLRYSGRTAVRAHIDVRERKPPEHAASPFSASMEGAPLRAGSDLAPFFWAPGWNSAQAVNKFQLETGGPLTETQPDCFLFGMTDASPRYYEPGTPPEEPDGLLFLPAHRVFGSEEMSALAPAIAARGGPPILSLTRADAAIAGVDEGDRVVCELGGGKVFRTIHIEDRLPEGVAIVTAGLPGEAALDAPGGGTIRRMEDTSP